MDQEMRFTVREVVSEVAAVPLEDVMPGARLLEDLGMDSLDFAKLEQELSEALGVEVDARSLQGVKTVGELEEKLEEI
jgi:acyl carrier protein